MDDDDGIDDEIDEMMKKIYNYYYYYQMIHMDQKKIVRDCHLWNDDLGNHIELMMIDLNKNFILLKNNCRKLSLLIKVYQQKILIFKRLIIEQYYFYVLFVEFFVCMKKLKTYFIYLLISNLVSQKNRFFLLTF